MKAASPYKQAFKVGDKVIINPVRKEKYRELVRESVGTVIEICSYRYDDRLAYYVRFAGVDHTYIFTAYDLEPAPKLIVKVIKGYEEELKLQNAVKVTKSLAHKPIEITKEDVNLIVDLYTKFIGPGNMVDPLNADAAVDYIYGVLNSPNFKNLVK